MQPGFLGRVDQSLPSYGPDPGILDQGELMSRLKGESFIGGQLSPQEQQSLGMMGEFAGSAGNRSADTANLIARRRANMDTAGQVSAPMQQYGSLLEQEYQRSRDIDPEMQRVLELRQQGLGGLNSAENNALLEQMTGNTNAAFSGGLRDIANSRARSGLGGGVSNAAYRDLMDDYAGQQFGARNDIMLKNVDVQNQRLGSYQDLASLLDQQKYGRAQETLGRFGDFTNLNDQNSYNRSTEALNLFEDSTRGAETDEFNRGAAARGAYADASLGMGEASRADRFNRLRNYQDELYRTKQDNFTRSMANINTLAQEVSARTGVALGVPQYLESTRNQRDANALAQQQIDVSRGGAGGRGRSSSGGSPITAGSPQQTSGFRPSNLNSGSPVSTTSRGAI